MNCIKKLFEKHLKKSRHLVRAKETMEVIIYSKKQDLHVRCAHLFHVCLLCFCITWFFGNILFALIQVIEFCNTPFMQYNCQKSRERKKKILTTLY